MLEINNISFSYNLLPTLKNISFNVDNQGLINKIGNDTPNGGPYYFNYRICDANYPTICKDGAGSILVYSNARPAKEIINNPTETNESVFDLEQLQLYPNPSNGIFNLAFQEIVKTELNLSVVNLLGQSLYESNIVNKKDFELDLSNFTSGTYLLKISHEQKIITKKLIIK
jgi:Secretion system C-terminal sorting domain